MSEDRSGPNSPTELEIKFSVLAGAVAALHAYPAPQDPADGPSTRHEVTPYFDTPDRGLARAGAICGSAGVARVCRR